MLKQSTSGREKIDETGELTSDGDAWCSFPGGVGLKLEKAVWKGGTRLPRKAYIPEGPDTKLLRT